MTRDKVRELAWEVGQEKYPALPPNHGAIGSVARRWEEKLRAFLAEQSPPVTRCVEGLVEELFVASRQREIWRESMAAIVNRFLSERESDLQTQLHRALGEGAVLWEALSRAIYVHRAYPPEGCDTTDEPWVCSACPAELPFDGSVGPEEATAQFPHDPDCPSRALKDSPLSEAAGSLLDQALHEDEVYECRPAFRRAALALRAELAREGGGDA